MHFSVIRAAIVLIALAWMSAAEAAETRFVTDGFEIMLRTGPDTTNRIISQIRSGQKVEIVKPGDDWSEVIAPNGKQGWVLTRYLTKAPPPSVVVGQLTQRHAEMQSENERLKQDLAALKDQNQQLSTNLERNTADLTSLTTAHETLKTESSDFIDLKAAYDKTLQERDEASVRAEQAEIRLNKLAGSEFNKGLLYGGGLLIFGFVSGYILKRPRRRGPLM